LVGTKYCNSIYDINFITDEVLLIQFKSGLYLKFWYNGVMMPLGIKEEIKVMADKNVPMFNIAQTSFRYKEQTHLLLKSDEKEDSKD
jgi:hypothetical protein